MTPHLDLFAVQPPPYARPRRRAMSRVLATAEPLSEPREPAAFVHTMLGEYRKADHGEGRARHELREAVERGAPMGEQERLSDIHHALLTRMARVEAALIARVRGI